MANVKFWAACLASYNNGELHGAWIEASSDVDEMQAQISAMLRASKFPNVTVEHEGQQVPSAEEWLTHDWDDETGLFSALGETSDLKRIAYLAELCEMAEEDICSDNGIAILSAYYDHVGRDYMPERARDAVQQVQDAYAGQFDSWADWAEQFLEDTGGLSEVPEHLRGYFDFAAYGRDAELAGDMFESAGFYFWNH